MYDELKAQSNQPGCGPNLPVDPGARIPLRQQIFEHIRANGRSARAEVTRALNISAGSATTLTAELISEGTLQEVDGRARETGRGRPPVDLEVVADRHFVVGMKLSDRKHTAVLSDFAGNVIGEASLSAKPARRSLPVLLDEVSDLISDLLAGTGKTVSDLSGIGVGLSGIIETETGKVPWSPLLKDTDVVLSNLLEDKFGCPVSIDNDANVLTLAELWFGIGRTLEDFVVITVEHGVGMGLVLNNRLFRGSGGMGLELGHTKVQLDGALCRCGQRGCLEAYVADYALAREAGAAMINTPSDVPEAVLESLFEEAKNGNPAARTIFRRAGRYLSVGLANVVQLFDPGLIILAGERMQYDFLYEEDVIEEMQALTLSEGRSPAKVVTHAWGDYVWARGASALALSDLTDRVVGRL